jgi:proline dehydrogenase
MKGRYIMNYYLLSDQDLDEIIWDIENLTWQIQEKVRDKFINEVSQESEDKLEGD